MRRTTIHFLSKVPTFPNLKHLDVSICFHEYNFEAVVMMLRHSTALESLKLYHKSSDVLPVKRGKGNAWRSRLPHNSDGNNQYACFKNIHLGENRRRFNNLISMKCTPKKQRIDSWRCKSCCQKQYFFLFSIHFMIN